MIPFIVAIVSDLLREFFFELYCAVLCCNTILASSLECVYLRTYDTLASRTLYATLYCRAHPFRHGNFPSNNAKEHINSHNCGLWLMLVACVWLEMWGMAEVEAGAGAINVPAFCHCMHFKSTHKNRLHSCPSHQIHII